MYRFVRDHVEGVDLVVGGVGFALPHVPVENVGTGGGVEMCDVAAGILPVGVFVLYVAFAGGRKKIGHGAVASCQCGVDS